MSKTPKEKEDEIAQAAINAANAEAEAEEAEAENEAAQAAATGVAAANAGAALATAEGAKAQQRAAADIERNQEENKWLREAVSNLHRNSEAQGAALTETRQELNSLKPLLAGIAERLTPVKSPDPEPDPSQVEPKKAARKKEEENPDGKNRLKPSRRML